MLSCLSLPKLWPISWTRDGRVQNLWSAYNKDWRFVNVELRQEHQCATCVQHQLHYTRVLPRLITNAVLLGCMQPPMAWRLPPQKYSGVHGVSNIIWQFVHGLLEHKYPLVFPINCWIQFFDPVVSSIQVCGVQCYIWFTEIKQKQLWQFFIWPTWHLQRILVWKTSCFCIFSCFPPRCVGCTEI